MYSWVVKMQPSTIPQTRRLREPSPFLRVCVYMAVYDRMDLLQHTPERSQIRGCKLSIGVVVNSCSQSGTQHAFDIDRAFIGLSPPFGLVVEFFGAYFCRRERRKLCSLCSLAVRCFCRCCCFLLFFVLVKPTCICPLVGFQPIRSRFCRGLSAPVGKSRIPSVS